MPNVYFIPNGPKNLQPLFPGLDFTQVASYYLEVLDETAAVVASTPLNLNIKPCDDDIRLHFESYAGGIDSMIFKLTDVEHETTSDSIQKSIVYPLIKNIHALNRINIKANDTYVVQRDFTEDNMDWIMELLDSPYAWLEWAATQGQVDDYLPIVILNKKSVKRKFEERFAYTVTVEFMLSHDKMLISG